MEEAEEAEEAQVSARSQHRTEHFAAADHAELDENRKISHGWHQISRVEILARFVSLTRESGAKTMEKTTAVEPVLEEKLLKTRSNSFVRG